MVGFRCGLRSSSFDPGQSHGAQPEVPRWGRLTIMLMAGFMSLPIPLTNTAPSFVIFVLAAGMLEEDGLLLLGGLLLAPVAAAIAGAAVYVAATLGPGAMESTVKPMIRALIGG